MYIVSQSTSRARAFTLIELLVVMAILASLAAILIPIIVSARKAAKVTAATNLMSQIVGALERFSEVAGCYPPQGITGNIPAFMDAKQRLELSEQMDSATTLGYLLCSPVLIPGKSPLLELTAKEAVPGPNNLPQIVDPWGNPWNYARGKFPVGTNNDRKLPTLTDESGKPWDFTFFNNFCTGTRNGGTGEYDLYSWGPKGPPPDGKLESFAGDPSELIARWGN